MTEPNESEIESSHTTEVATFVASGGALTSGLAVAGTSVIGFGLLPVAALGMVVGLAAYGVKRALFDDVKSDMKSDTETSSQSQIPAPVPTVTAQDDGVVDSISMSADI